MIDLDKMDELVKENNEEELVRRALISEVYQLIVKSGLTVRDALSVLESVQTAVQAYSYVSSSSQIVFTVMGSIKFPRRKQS